MRAPSLKRFGSIAVAIALLLGSVTVLGTVGTSAHEGTAHPSHVHDGSCPVPGDVIFPLADVAIPDGEVVGSGAAVPVDISVTTIESTLADLVAAPHAIVVHESAENIGNYILCGDIGGPMMGESDLPIGLAQLNESGAAGVAWLTDNGDGTTDVSVLMTEPTDDHGTDGHDTGTPVEVSIADFSFGAAIEVPAGTTVTWTNNDSAPHTVTGDGGLQSGKMDSGATYSFTFEEAGTFNYHCEFHGNMSSTISVV